MPKKLVTLSSIVLCCGALAGPSLASADVGAIAVNPQTGAFGKSFNYNTVAAAKKRALNECPGKACRLLVIIRNGWGAVVKTPQPNVEYWGGFARTKAGAIRNARQRSGNGNAKRYVTVFSG